MSAALLLRFVSIVGSAISFYLLLSVVPLLAASSGDRNLAGLATSALMFSSVAGELTTPSLAGRFGYRRVLAIGLLLLGAPAFVLIIAAGPAAIMAVSLVRGLGFGITVVAGGALTASLIPPERRGEGLAITGVVAGVPGMIALPLGVLLAGRIGYPMVFAIGGVAAVAAVAAIPGLPSGTSGFGRKASVRSGLRSGALMHPTIVFMVTAMGAGIVVTFIPLAAPSGSRSAVPLVLLVQPAASTIARLVAGRYGDRHGSALLLVPGVVITALGVLALTLMSIPPAMVAGGALFGVGFGITQNASLTLMYSRVQPSGYATVSALWNFAYDAGMGAGAAGFGAVVARSGFSGAFTLCALVILIAAVPAWRVARTETAMS